VHEGGWRVERGADGQWRFLRPGGRLLKPGQPLEPGRPRLGPEPVADLCAAQAGLRVDPDRLLPARDGTPVDYDWGARALRDLEAAAARPAG
jgi:hypothetical protein